MKGFHQEKPNTDEVKEFRGRPCKCRSWDGRDCPWGRECKFVDSHRHNRPTKLNKLTQRNRPGGLVSGLLGQRPVELVEAKHAIGRPMGLVSVLLGQRLAEPVEAGHAIDGHETLEEGDLADAKGFQSRYMPTNLALEEDEGPGEQWDMDQVAARLDEQGFQRQPSQQPPAIPLQQQQQQQHEVGAQTK